MQVVINGKSLSVSSQEVPPELLEYDRDNPRRYEIALDLERKGEDPKLAERAEGIERATRFRELRESIVENEGISLPLVVEAANGKFRLIDGDRRLGAVRHILRDENLLAERPELEQKLAKLPCLVVEGPLDEEERLTFLSHIHVHLAAWRPAAKRMVTKKLSAKLGEERAQSTTRTTSGSMSKGTLIDKYEGLFAFKGAQAVSWARELANLRQTLIDDVIVDATLQKAKNGKITSAVELRQLRDVLGDPEGREAYVRPDTTLQDAKHVLDLKLLTHLVGGPDLGFKDLLMRLVVGLRGIRFDELLRYKGDSEVKELVDECTALLARFGEYL